MLVNRCEWFDGLDYNKVMFRKNLCDMIGLYTGYKVYYIESIYYYNGYFRVDYCDNVDIINLHLVDGVATHIRNYIKEFSVVERREEKLKQLGI